MKYKTGGENRLYTFIFSSIGKEKLALIQSSDDLSFQKRLYVDRLSF